MSDEKLNLDLQQKVITTIQKYHLIEKSDKVLVGVSGGPDSISLLHILHALGYVICVAHVHHGIRENADLDEKYVADFCQKRNIPFFVKHIDLKKLAKGMTIEEAGRKARYEFFYEIFDKEKCTKIATAHNSSDNAETVLMNIIRGTGMSGLKGILPLTTSNDKKYTLIRPLIQCSRQEIEAYCLENTLHPRHDESNDETIYTRNKVRLELIPYIEKNLNSNVIGNLNRLSEIACEEEQFIVAQVEQALEKCLAGEEENKVVCNLKIFNTLDIVLRKRLILKFIIKVLGNAKDIEKVHVEDILKLCENNVGGKYLTPNKHLKILIHKSHAEYLKI